MTRITIALPFFKKQMTINAILFLTFFSYSCLGQQANENKLIVAACYSNATAAKEKEKPSYSPALTLLKLYQLVVSKQISANCEFSPSCSNFSIEAIKTKGLIKGILMTADRLMRCNGHSHKIAEPYLIDPKSGKINDPAKTY